MKGRLNLFQAEMLRWRELYPYNAVHVVRIDRPLDRTRLAAIIDAHLAAVGLTGYALDAKRGRYAWTGGPAATALTVHPGGALPVQALERAVEQGLNGPFERTGRLNPFRWFCIDNGTWFQLALVYDHVVAGGDSVVLLLAGLVARYCVAEAEARPARPVETCLPTYRRLFLRHAWPAVRGIRRLKAMAASARRSLRPVYPRGEDPHNAFAYGRLDAPQFSALARAAKRWDVTINDVLMAMLLDVLAPFAGERNPAHARHELAVASILNLGRDLGIDAGATFGQTLSSFRVSHPVPPGISLEQLARDVRAETASIKRERLYLQSLIGVAASGALWRFLTPERRRRFHAKHYPVWGALTTLDVNALWARAGGRMPPPEYVRAGSTGPLAPIVVTATTVGEVLHLGITYRTAAFTAENIGKMAAGFVACAARLDQ